ncbi:MAG: hypothetical protein WD557_01320 [Dehalococcoidia bacterium]
MAANRDGIHITDPVATTAGPNGNGTYQFALAPTGQGGRGYTLETRAWQPGDPSTPWRIPLHDCSQGLARNKMEKPGGYALVRHVATVDAATRMDCSWGTMVPPPQENIVTLDADDSTKIIHIQSEGKLFLIGGRFCFTIDLDGGAHADATDKDFGVGKSAVDAALFNDEIIVAMGASEKIWKRSAAGVWSQAADDTFAIALGVVGDRLYRAHDTNQVSGCTAAPLTLASWSPADPNEYVVSDQSFAIEQLIDYGGTLWPIRKDGAFQADPSVKFHNQTPQSAQFPNPKSARWAFTAGGYLYVPGFPHSLRVGRGRSRPLHPESLPEKGAFIIHHGVEAYGSLFLIVTLGGNGFASGQDVWLVRAIPVGTDGFVFHPLAPFTFVNIATVHGGFLVAAQGSSPGYLEIGAVFPTHADATGRYHFFALGRSTVPYFDESDYDYPSASEWNSGDFVPAEGDATVESVLMGCEIAYRASSGDSFQLRVSADRSTTYQDLLSTQEGSGSIVISGAAGYPALRATRYAPANTNGQMFNIRLIGEVDSPSRGPDRPEVYGLWAFGFSRPKQLDAISLAIVADENAMIGGRRLGMGRAEIVRVFRAWKNSLTVLTLRIPDYETGRTTRFLVTNVQETETNATVGASTNASASSIVMVELTRCDFADAYAD